MSTQYNSGSRYENHQRAAELHDSAAHAHGVADQQGKAEHLTGHEHSRQALEYSQQAHHYTQEISHEHGIAPLNHQHVAMLAFELWIARGRPEGSPQEDWFKAAETLRSARGSD